jgi:hypothetical protein
MQAGLALGSNSEGNQVMTKQSPLLPSWSVYGNYASGNYGAHALRFTVGHDTFWFSYKTLVAFQHGYEPIVVHTNDWAQTTGKHLNAIDGGNKKARLSAADFEAAFIAAFGRKIAA